MIEISLQPVPNQSFSFNIAETSFDVVLKTADSLTASVAINGEPVIQGIRVMAYRPVLPYAYLTQGAGNLFFITADGEAPDYKLFGLTQTLVYATAAEVESLHAY